MRWMPAGDATREDLAMVPEICVTSSRDDEFTCEGDLCGNLLYALGSYVRFTRVGGDLRQRRLGDRRRHLVVSARRGGRRGRAPGALTHRAPAGNPLECWRVGGAGGADGGISRSGRRVLRVYPRTDDEASAFLRERIAALDTVSVRDAFSK